MPSFLDVRTASFFSWPQGPYTIPGHPNQPFFLSRGEAYWFNELPHRLRLPTSPWPGTTTSFVVKGGGSVDVEDDRGHHVETINSTPGSLVTFTYINPVEGWRLVKI